LIECLAFFHQKARHHANDLAARTKCCLDHSARHAIPSAAVPG
jgi:hypothetical protein